jgi:hypothetical protein
VIVATITKGSAVPAPVSARSSMPMATVPTQIGMPERATANGRFHTVAAIHMIASPARNGHAVSSSPPRVAARACSLRPRPANRPTSSASHATASAIDAGRAPRAVSGATSAPQ